MKTIALVTASLVAPLSSLAPAQSADTLRAKCAEQERQIKELEKEIDSLHALLAKSGDKPTITSKQGATNTSYATYKVQKGDTMSSIARKNGVSLADMLAANSSINANRLSIGQELKLPGKAPAKSISKAEPVMESAIPNTVTNYTVKSGDTLYSIARTHGTTVAAIAACNDKLNARSLRVGQRISLPGSKESSAKPSPQPAVAKKAPAPKPAPAAKRETPTPKPAPAVAKKQPAPQKKESVQQVSHTPQQMKIRTVTVDQQMTYGQFASMHGVSIDQVNELNNLTLTKSTVLAQGSELYIPGASH
ncbi:hypothetical protein Rhal01_01204 [Rubritalea halochordaticola]|uniref:LysM domain-containing protein n=1 Tax=Rubritalea halochordaticola TaxID=714537 RepID=A0ABP9V0A5_9BACT